MAQKLDSLQSRLKYSRRSANLTQLEVADLVGMKQPSYSSLERNKDQGGSKFLPAIAKVLGVDVNWLVFGSADSEEAPLSNECKISVVTFPIVQPEFDTKCGEISLSNILSYIHLSPNVLRSVKNKAQHIKFIEMQNKSMSPMLNKNDLIGFDYKQTQVIDGCIYLVLFEGEFMFRQIFKETGGFLILKSLNDHIYPDKRVLSNAQGFKVVGTQCFRIG